MAILQRADLVERQPARSNDAFVQLVLGIVADDLAAALGHMLFNFFASIGADDTMMAIMGWGIALTLVIYLIRRILAERGEPVSGLPEALEALARQSGLASLIATHNHELAGLMDRRVTIEDGLVRELA